MIAEGGMSRRVVAPDMLGNGDSDMPKLVKTDIGYYVDCALRTLDALELEQVDFYGSHTGAQIGLQLATAHPDRIRRIVLDGLPLFPPELKTQLLAHYAPVKEADDFGGQLLWAWNFIRDQSWHFPYFMRDSAHRLTQAAIPSAPAMHMAVVDVLKALPTYHLAYNAAFAQNVAVLAPGLRTPALVMCVETDPLGIYMETVAAMIPDAATARVKREDRLATILAFLDA